MNRFFTKLWAKRTSTVSRRQERPGRARFLPRLETLEDRLVPSGYSFYTIDPPGAAPASGITTAEGINDRLQIVGSYADANGVHHGFLRSHDQFVTLDDPNASLTQFLGTFATGINNAGQIVGGYSGVSGPLHGFLLSDGQYTTIDDPNAASNYPGGYGTSLNGINDLGQIVGQYLDANNVYHGFLLSDGHFTPIDDPNHGTTTFGGTYVAGINDQGQIVGGYRDATGARHGFLLSGDQYTTLDDPNSPAVSTLGTVAVGINNIGQIVGFYGDANYAVHGFLLSAGQYTTVDDPNGTSNGYLQGTIIEGINDRGMVEGGWSTGNANFTRHAFLGVPTPGSPGTPAVNLLASQGIGAPHSLAPISSGDPSSVNSSHNLNQDQQAESSAAGSARRNVDSRDAFFAAHAASSKHAGDSGSDPFAINYDMLV